MTNLLKKSTPVLALLVMTIGLALRVFQLDAQSLWFDEGWSWHLANLPLGEMARITAGDRSPALYYALLHLVMAAFGDSESTMRAISVIADVTALALVMALSHTLWRRALPALVAGAIYAINPFAIWYAQEARMYALLAALCTASSLFLARWVFAVARPPARRDLAASALLLALAIHTHYYAVFLLPAQGLAVLVAALGRSTPAPEAPDRRFVSRFKPLIPWAVAAAGVMALVVPWLIFASGGFAYDDGFHFPLNTVDTRLLEWLRAFVSGGLGRPMPDYWLVALLAAMAAACAGWVIGGRGRELGFVLALSAGSLLAAAVAVRVVYPYRSVFHPRYLIYAAPAACVLLAGITARGRAAVRWPLNLAWAAAILATLSIGWSNLTASYTNPAYRRDDVRGAVKHVAEALIPGDVVVMSRDNYAASYYWRALAPGQPLLAAPEGLHGVLHDETRLISQLNALRPNRVRLLLWQDDVVDPSKLAESTLWANGRQLGEYNFGQIRLPLFQMQPGPVAPLRLEPLSAAFDGGLALTGYWTAPRITPGDLFYVVLRWNPSQAQRSDDKVFVHVLDDAGAVVFQSDKLPLNERMPMTQWTPGVELRDPYAMVARPDLPPGRYHVRIGVYNPVTGARRAITQGGLGDALDLVTIEIIGSPAVKQ